MDQDILDLIEQAKLVSQNSYSPYSHFSVGAALLTSTGKVYTGCNIENDGIQSICAERVAFCKAISEGETSFTSIAVVGKPKENINFTKALPCGYCRQFMNEFCSSDFKVYTYTNDNNTISCFTLSELLPYGFHV